MRSYHRHHSCKQRTHLRVWGKWKKNWANTKLDMATLQNEWYCVFYIYIYCHQILFSSIVSCWIVHRFVHIRLPTIQFVINIAQSTQFSRRFFCIFRCFDCICRIRPFSRIGTCFGSNIVFIPLMQNGKCRHF